MVAWSAGLQEQEGFLEDEVAGVLELRAVGDGLQPGRVEHALQRGRRVVAETAGERGAGRFLKPVPARLRRDVVVVEDAVPARLEQAEELPRVTVDLPEPEGGERAVRAHEVDRLRLDLRG